MTEPGRADDDLRDRLFAARRDGDPIDRRAVLARVQQGLFDDSDEPLRIGRFVVSRRLGAGASGVVYAAHDPKLDRMIALKLLRPDGDLGNNAHERLLREAQSLARLSHRHVVSVHDVGDLDDRVFIAMELLEGGTLRHWSEERPRSVSEILAVYLQAGEGLAAAHAAGLVHRDFKPDNVLLDDRGRAAVVDFGLAREQIDPGMSVVDAVATGELPGVEVDSRLTRTGAVLGTPAYMAPEQFAGRRADARTDQYSFCVALYEALYGERPFDGDTLPALAMAAQRGELRPAPSGRSVPAWVRRAIVRGLRPEPAQRFDSMDALLAALRRDPWARWRRRALGAGALAGAVALTWLVADRPPAAATAAPCSGVERHLDGVWDEDQRAAAAAGLDASGHPAAGATWERLQPRLDTFADAWVTARREVCEAQQVRGEDSDALLDRKILCLDRALLALGSGVQRLSEADRETVARAQELVPDSTLVDECGDEGVLDDGESPPTDPELRARLREVERGMADATSLRLAGRYEDALARAEQLAVEAEALGHAPLYARVLLEQASILSQVQRAPEAIDALAEALTHAERSRADRTRASIYTLMVKRLADAGKFDEARRMAPLAASIYERLARPPVGTAVRVHLLWGQLEWMQGHYEEAIERFDRAASASADSTDVTADVIMAGLHSEAVGHRGAAELEAGHYDRALDDLQRAVTLREQLVGPEHPEMASLHTNLGLGLLRQGDMPGAEQHLRRSLEIRERRLGEDHESLATTLSNLGAVVMRRGGETDEAQREAMEEAMGYYRRALELMRRSLGPDDPQLAFPLHNMALAHLRRDEPDDARALVQQALDLRRRALGPHHARTLDSMYQLAYVQMKAGDHEGARTTYEEYLALLVEHRPDDASSQVYARVGLADVAIAQGRHARAQRHLEIARELLGPDNEDADLHAAVAFDLAITLDAQGTQATRARALAEEALENVRDSARRTAIETWLTEHPPSR